MAKIRVLIVDDSVVMRNLIRRILSSDADIEVVASAHDAYEAREKLIEFKPDLMTLDIEMPRMDGITFLEKVMASAPVRTLIIARSSPQSSDTWRRALAAGAVDILAKPTHVLSETFDGQWNELITRVKLVAHAQLPSDRQPLKSVKAKKSPAELAKAAYLKQHIVAIAASTGGTEALKVLLSQLPAEIPPTLIVQHMPPGFTLSFAKQLNKLCPFEVKEAKDGDRLSPGLALLAPGNFHMEISKSGSISSIRLHQEQLLHGVRPAADYLFQSVAKYFGKNALGIILTGMGHDGAEGLLAMHKAGAFTLAQDEASSVVFGMPKMAIEAGGIDRVLALDEIASFLKEEFTKHK
ncbi:MAG: chemotaxis response regulator protein-glutamate methylesterase [Proteobacteria bacterium]|nr:chemotaxis response regulator protein-glutamate methylesterase [Pseudomonadota bacterium]